MFSVVLFLRQKQSQYDLNILEDTVETQMDSFRKFLAKQAMNVGNIAGMWKIALPPLEKLAYKIMIEKGDRIKNGSLYQREDKFYMVFNVLRAAFKAYDNSSPTFRSRITNIFIKEFLGPGPKHQGVKQEFKEKYGVYPPGFVTISPEGTCNLKCKNCYASSINSKLEHLSSTSFTKILYEKYEKWGSWFTVISGGEPFMWQDNGLDLIDIAAQHPEQIFMVYTNGTLIDKRKAERIASVGNILPAVSVEGFQKETDKRRGEGTFKRILEAFENMREKGVPFGISITANNDNVDVLFSDDFFEFYFEKQCAVFEWIFQYMPIGRGVDVADQLSPEKRRDIWFREQELIREKRLVIADFWNSGSLSSGCIAAGREDGYLYIDWKGNVYPCVFVPYFKDNINKLYSEQKLLTDALFSDLFEGIRDWQLSYSFRKPPKIRGNEIRPCFMRDHHEHAHNLFIKTHAFAGNESAEICLNDCSYIDAMKKYGDKLSQLLDPIWEEKYRI